VILQIQMAMAMKSTVFWSVTQSCFVYRDQRFRRNCYLHLQGRKAKSNVDSKYN
jgi:hypothetical protein